MIQFSRKDFETAVDDAIDLIPDELFRAMENVVILIGSEPPDHSPGVLGLYEGVPLTERDSSWAGSLPDTIHIFQGPLQRMCSTREELVHEITVTVVHEIAHFFGIPESRLHGLGWG
ncbi:metallopeptidase family protein [Kocuria coralli]|uniref:metallopeptidase family protein n=1 Tax=Kocuria coralli TaxID=1461025 RepID=UPI001FE9ABF6|nr:metallopeptidase family protein [Kocuria coralli]